MTFNHIKDSKGKTVEPGTYLDKNGNLVNIIIKPADFCSCYMYCCLESSPGKYKFITEAVSNSLVDRVEDSDRVKAFLEAIAQTPAKCTEPISAHLQVEIDDARLCR